MKFTTERSFVWAKHKDRDFEGWRPEDAPEFDPGPGFIVAHDMMEHLTKDPAFPCELMAFGTTLWGRMVYDPQNVVMSARDLSGFLQTQKDVKSPDGVVGTHPLKPEAEARLQTFMQVTFETIGLDQFVGDGIKRTPRQAWELLQRVQGWVRLGYRLAERRYAGHTPTEVVETEIALAEAVNDDHNDNPPREGDRLTITFNAKDLSFNLKRSRVLETV